MLYNNIITEWGVLSLAGCLHSTHKAATAEQTRAKLGMYESRSRAMPQLRHQLMEVLTEKKLQLERQYLSEEAPVQDRHAAEVKAILDGKSAKVKRRMQPPTPSMLGYN